eukprot:UN17151
MFVRAHLEVLSALEEKIKNMNLLVIAFQTGHISLFLRALKYVLILFVMFSLTHTMKYLYPGFNVQGNFFIEYFKCADSSLRTRKRFLIKQFELGVLGVSCRLPESLLLFSFKELDQPLLFIHFNHCLR